MSNQPLHIAIIGGGAAGYFAAIEAKRNCPDADITIFEKSKKRLELGIRNWCAARILNFGLIPTELTERTEAYGDKLMESTEWPTLREARTHRNEGYILQAIISVHSVV